MNYVIRYNDQKYLVSAQHSFDAVAHWMNDMQSKREVDGLNMKFNPQNFSVEAISDELHNARRYKLESK